MHRRVVRRGERGQFGKVAEVERWWFRIHAANTDLPFPYDPDQTGQDFEALCSVLDHQADPAATQPSRTAGYTRGSRRLVDHAV